jgi:hypothetical protein
MDYEGFPPCVCRDHEPELVDRPMLFLPVIVVMFVSFGVLVVVARLPYGVQLGSLIPYTAFIFLVTFAAERGQQPYFLECPIVRETMASMVRRHCGFLVGLVGLETVGFYLATYMPAWWLTAKGRDASLLVSTIFALCLFLGFIQIVTNRALIKRAHLAKQAALATTRPNPEMPA